MKWLIIMALLLAVPEVVWGQASGHTVRVCFTDQQGDDPNAETGFEVNRKVPGGSWALWQSPAASAGSGADICITDTDAFYPTSCYQVVAVNSFGNSTILGGDNGVCHSIGTRGRRLFRR